MLVGCATTQYSKIAHSPNETGIFAKKEEDGLYKITARYKFHWRLATWTPVQKARVSIFRQACEILKRDGFNSFEIIDEKIDLPNMSFTELFLRSVTLIGLFIPSLHTSNFNLTVRGVSENERANPNNFFVIDIFRFLNDHPAGGEWPVRINELMSFPPDSRIDLGDGAHTNSSSVVIFKENARLEGVDSINLKDRSIETYAWISIPPGVHKFTVSYFGYIGNDLVYSENNFTQTYDLKSDAVYQLKTHASSSKNIWTGFKGSWGFEIVEIPDPRRE
jgi:hypothetical protein